MSGVTVTLLQVITIGMSFLIGYLLNKKAASLWRIFFGLLISCPFGWLFGVVIWAVLFMSSNPYDAIVIGMQKSLIFALIGSGMGVYFGRSKTKSIKTLATSDAIEKVDELNSLNTDFSSSSEKGISHPSRKLRKVPLNSVPVEMMETTKNTSVLELYDEAFWAEALKEFEGAERRTGLWARSFAQAKGDETQAKVAYLEVRARELAQAHQSLLLEQERYKRLKEQEDRLAALTEEERAYELLPKGICPNCNAVQPLDSEECSSCKAIFDSSSAWRLTPLPIESL